VESNVNQKMWLLVVLVSTDERRC